MMTKARDQFEREHVPLGRKSKLAPFLDDIRELRVKGYTLAQIQIFLSENGVRITAQGIADYLRRKPDEIENREISKRERREDVPVKKDAPDPKNESKNENSSESTLNEKIQHSPETLNNIMSRQPDIDTLISMRRNKTT
jgi:DNA-binding transcriptional MerR regulator